MAFTFLWLFPGIYGVAFLVLALSQRTFMYYPQRGTEAEFLALAPPAKVLPWRDQSEQLIGWKRIGKDAKYRMLILHGNGGHGLTRTYFMDGFDATLWDFYVLEYPGYGWRTGNANQSEIVSAADNAVTHLRHSDNRPLFITGESLGTGVACLMAERHRQKIKGLFLVTPFTSTADVAAGRFPMFPTRLVMQDKYEAAKALEKYSGRVAVLLAGRDFNVPTRFGQKLFDGYRGPKKLWIQPDAGHNSLDYDPGAAWWKEVSEFLISS